jgi:hypothetical protein
MSAYKVSCSQLLATEADESSDMAENGRPTARYRRLVEK